MPITITTAQTGPTVSTADIRGHAVIIDRPEAKGGSNAGPMGGELLLAALAGCFASNLYAAIDAREADLSNVHITVEGDLSETPARYETIRMHVTANGNDADQLTKLVTMSERACIVANTLKTSVTLQLTSALVR